jgi:hypothetical protein
MIPTTPKYFEKEPMFDGSFLYTEPLDKPQHAKSFIYFLQRGETGPIKIGRSTQLKRRIRVLQTACAEKLRLICAVEGDWALELAWHNQFNADRLQGEWFRPDRVLNYLDRQFFSGL